MNPKIFVHISDDSLYLGNGGLRSMSHLANAIAEMGHETYVFGQNDRLTWDKFKWLSWGDFKFKIAKKKFLFQTENRVVVTSWLNRLMVNQARLVDGFKVGNVRYLERDEIARAKYATTADFIRANFKKIAISNRALTGRYDGMGFDEIIPIENWFRHDLFYYDKNKKIKGLVGFQGSKKEIYQPLIRRFGDRAIACEGNQARVAGRMRRAEFFVYLNPPKHQVTLYEGEGFGNPLYEAMACGCVCVALKHDGTEYLEYTIPLMYDAIGDIRVVIHLSESEKEDIREWSLELVEARFRLNDAKKESIERFLE